MYFYLFVISSAFHSFLHQFYYHLEVGYYKRENESGRLEKRQQLLKERTPCPKQKTQYLQNPSTLRHSINNVYYHGLKMEMCLLVSKNRNKKNIIIIMPVQYCCSFHIQQNPRLHSCKHAYMLCVSL